MVVCWLAYKKLPYNFFDDEVTQNFFNYLNPNSEMPRRNPMKRNTMTQFEEMKRNLKTTLQANSSKFSYTVDGWTARNAKSYYGITLHYIDDDWVLQSMVLGFIAQSFIAQSSRNYSR